MVMPSEETVAIKGSTVGASGSTALFKPTTGTFESDSVDGLAEVY